MRRALKPNPIGRPDRENDLFRRIPESFSDDLVRLKRIGRADLAVRPILARDARDLRTRRQQRRSRRALRGGLREQSGDQSDHSRRPSRIFVESGSSDDPRIE